MGAGVSSDPIDINAARGARHIRTASDIRSEYTDRVKRSESSQHNLNTSLNSETPEAMNRLVYSLITATPAHLLAHLID